MDKIENVLKKASYFFNGRRIYATLETGHGNISGYFRHHRKWIISVYFESAGEAEEAIELLVGKGYIKTTYDDLPEALRFALIEYIEKRINMITSALGVTWRGRR